MTDTAVDYVELVDRAHTAAKEAVADRIAELEREQPYRHHDHHGCCGFAWVEVPLGRHPFITAMRRAIRCFSMENTENGEATPQNIHYRATQLYGKRQDYGSRAWQFWNPADYGGQNLDLLELGAREFAIVLQGAGITAHARSRMD